MKMNTRDKLKFIITQNSYLCGPPFTEKNYKVRDHSHLDGKYRGASHLQCNLSAKKDYSIPVILHNLYGYDLHLLLKHLTRRMTKIKVIAKTCEHYVCVTLWVTGTHVKFILLDSFKFLPGSLSSLAKLLPAEDKKLIREEFSKNYSLLLEKLSFPYENNTGWGALEQTQLPKIEEFYSHLTWELIIPSEYEHTKLIWETFCIQTMGQLADLYLKIDVLLLTGVFGKFREECLKTHKLDPCY